MTKNDKLEVLNNLFLAHCEFRSSIVTFLLSTFTEEQFFVMEDYLKAISSAMDSSLPILFDLYRDIKKEGN